MPLETGTILTLSLGCSKAIPKTSKPGPKLAVVAGAFTTTSFGNGISIIPDNRQHYSFIKILPIKTHTSPDFTSLCVYLRFQVQQSMRSKNLRKLSKLQSLFL